MYGETMDTNQSQSGAEQQDSTQEQGISQGEEAPQDEDTPQVQDTQGQDIPQSQDPFSEQDPEEQGLKEEEVQEMTQEQDVTKETDSTEGQEPEFTIVVGGSNKGYDILVEKSRYTYCRDGKASSKGKQRWRCSTRNKAISCNASVVQTGDTFTKGTKKHICSAKDCAKTMAMIKSHLRREGKARPFASGSTLVKEALEQLLPDEIPSSLPKVTSLIRSTNNMRQAQRPKDAGEWMDWAESTQTPDYTVHVVSVENVEPAQMPGNCEVISNQALTNSADVNIILVPSGISPSIQIPENPANMLLVPAAETVNRTQEQQPDEDSEFSIVIGGSSRGSNILVEQTKSNHTYHYVKDGNKGKKGQQRWRCHVRTKSVSCSASVLQTGNEFKRGPQPHRCAAKDRKSLAKLKAYLRREARARPFASGSTLVKEALKKYFPDEQPSSLPNMAALVKSTNHSRRHGGLQKLPSDHDYDVSPSSFSIQQERIDHAVNNTRSAAQVMDESNKDYFRAYEDFNIHELMLKDQPRTLAYKNFIDKNAGMFQDKVVVDVGAGTGILSLFAAQAGAAKVYAIEASNMSQVCAQIVAVNGFSDQITVIQGKAEDVRLPDGQKADILISEWMGFYLFHESMLNTVITARDNLLKPDGLMLPSSASLYVCPVSMKRLWEDKFEYWDNVYGFDFSPMIVGAQTKALSQPTITTINQSQCLSKPKLLTHLELLYVESDDIKNIVGNFKFDMCKSDLLHGFACWFDVKFEGESLVTLNTGPLSPETHWKQTVILLPQALLATKGDRVECRIQMTQDVSNPRAYNISVEMGDEPEQAEAQDSQLHNAVMAALSKQ